MLKIVSRSYNAARMRFISRWISAHTYNRSCFLYFPISAFHIRVRHFLHKTLIFKKSRIVAKYLVIWNSESRKCQDAKYSLFFYRDSSATRPHPLARRMHLDSKDSVSQRWSMSTSHRSKDKVRSICLLRRTRYCHTFNANTRTIHIYTGRFRF